MTTPGSRSHLPPAQGTAQPDLAAPGKVLRFAVSRQGVLDGLPAFRLPPRTNGSNLYAYMVVSAAHGRPLRRNGCSLHQVEH